MNLDSFGADSKGDKVELRGDCGLLAFWHGGLANDVAVLRELAVGHAVAFRDTELLGHRISLDAKPLGAFDCQVDVVDINVDNVESAVSA